LTFKWQFSGGSDSSSNVRRTNPGVPHYKNIHVLHDRCVSLHEAVIYIIHNEQLIIPYDRHPCMFTSSHSLHSQCSSQCYSYLHLSHQTQCNNFNLNNIHSSIIIHISKHIIYQLKLTTFDVIYVNISTQATSSDNFATTTSNLLV